MRTVFLPHFWRLATSGSSSRQRNGSKPWIITINLPNDIAQQLILGQYINTNTLTGTSNSSNPPEDMPYVGLHCTVCVSEKVKQLWNDLYPNNLQYIPCAISHINHKVYDNYYLVNPLNVVDCKDDSETSLRYGNQLGRAVIDPRRIPANVGIFRVARTTSTITIREDVRLAMIKNNITGWFVYEL